VVIRRHAERFGRVRFNNEIDAAIQDTLSAGCARPRRHERDWRPRAHRRC
jgi:hypothetical protein